VTGASGNETFCYLGYLVELISVESIDIFGCFIEILDLSYELP